MRTDFTVLTKLQFWKLFQRLEQMVERWGMSAADLEAPNEKLSNVKGEPEKDNTESSHNRACAASAAQQLRIENGLKRLEPSQRGGFPYTRSKELRTTPFNCSRITSFIDSATACALSLLVKSLCSFSA